MDTVCSHAPRLDGRETAATVKIKKKIKNSYTS